MSSFFADAQVKDSLLVLRDTSLLFASDQYILLDEHKAIIDSILLSSLDSYRIYQCEGHTDDIGSERYNEILAAKRAQVVSEYLLSQGITSSQIFTESYGELKPIKHNTNALSRSLNRRVSLRVYRPLRYRMIRGMITSDSSELETTAKVTISGKDFRDSTYTSKDGSWKLLAPDSTYIKIDITAPDHFFLSKVIKVTPALDTRTVELSLPKLKIGRSYAIPNLYYKGNLPVLVPSSEPTLELVLATMRSSKVCIDIQGHVNFPNHPPVPREHRYFKLSEARAKMVYRYLMDHGIATTRMTHQGFGNTHMIYPKARRESLMKHNRRVEIAIVACPDN